MTRAHKSYYRWGGVLLVCLMLVSGVAMAAERSTGQVVDDALVTTKIKASFAATQRSVRWLSMWIPSMGSSASLGWWRASQRGSGPSDWRKRSKGRNVSTPPTST